MVVIKVSIVLLVIIAGLFFIDVGQLLAVHPAVRLRRPPPVRRPTPSLLQDLGIAPGAFGISGIFTGAALVFFAYIGFDIVATAAEETKNPQRDMPIGILVLAGDLHGALRRGLPGGHRDGEVHRDQGRRAAGRGVPLGRATPASPR